MKHTETIYFQDKNQADIEVIKNFVREQVGSYLYRQVPLKSDISMVEITIEGRQEKIEYVVSGIRQKLTSLGYL